MKRKFFLGIACFFLIFFVSCIGLGEELDSEAPVLEVISPGTNMSYAPKKFKITGKATDNREVSKVEISYSYTDGSNHAVKGSKSAVITPVASRKVVDWECEFEFHDDYEIEFEITAYDLFNNTNEYSVDSRIIIIDTADPMTDELSVNRNGQYTVPLLAFDKMSEYNGSRKETSESKDFFQNGSVRLSVRLNDNYGIEDCRLTLKEIDLRKGSVTGTVLENFAPLPSEDSYSPEFEIKLSDLPSRFSKGTHFLQPSLKIRNTAGNEIVKSFKLFAWDESFDYPHVSSPQSDEHGTITVPLKSNVPLVLFDDDGLVSMKWKIVTEDEWKLSSAGMTAEEAIKNYPDSGFTGISFSERDGSVNLPTTNNAGGRNKLLLKIEDVNGKINYSALDLYLTNGEAAVLLAGEKNPQENTVPILNSGKFTLDFYTLDNEPVEKMAIAWVPGGNEDLSRAYEELAKFDFSTDYNETPKKAGRNIRIWNVRATQGNDENGKKKSLLRHEFNVFNSADENDFKIGSSLTNDNKVFIIYVEDRTGNVTKKEYRLNAIKTAPAFDVWYSLTGNDSDWELISDNLKRVSCNTIYLRVEPKSSVGVPLNTSGMTSTFAEAKPNDGRYWYYELENPAPNMRHEFGVSVTDNFSNRGERLITFDVGEKAELASIDVVNNDGAVVIKGEKVELQANFSANVKFENLPQINGKNGPRIKLTGVRDKSGSEVEAYAYYSSKNVSSPTSALYFDYIVPENVSCDKVAIAGAGSSSPIDVNGCKFTGLQKEVQQITKKVTVDGIVPVVSSKKQNGSTVERDGKGNIVVEIEFSKNVLSEKGSITVQRTAEWNLPSVISEDVFNAMVRTAGSLNMDKTTLTGGIDYGELIRSIGPYRQYTQGLKESGGKFVPDLTTKYVLDYSYDTAGSGTKEAALRRNLEKISYHKAVYDVSDSSHVTVSGKIVKITVKDEDFVDGIKDGCDYEILLSRGSFRDEHGNSSSSELVSASAGSGDKYEFKVGGVCKPYIRLNRTTSNSPSQIPSAKVEFKIDCESPGAEIKYATKEITTERDTAAEETGDENELKGKRKCITCSDVSSDAVKKISTGIYSDPVTIGDGSLYTTQRIYIKACTVDDDAHTDYECAYKTVVCDESPDKNKDGNLYVFASQIAEGVTSIPGWPLTQNKYEYGRAVAYEDGSTYYFVSWELIDNFCLQTAWSGGSSYQRSSAVNAPYGGYIYQTGTKHW